MKFLLVIVFALFSLIASQGCQNTIYVNVGEACSNGFNSTRSCKQFASCIGGRCKPSFIGAECKADSECFLNRRSQGDVACVKNKCVKYKYNNEWCESPDECYNSKCDRTCQGLKLDAPCDPNQYVQCERGLYCSLRRSKCERQRTLGETCDDYVLEGPGRNFNVICPGGSVCLSVQNSDKRCRKYGYVLEGGDCTFDNECVGMMRCNSRGVCSAAQLNWGQACIGASRNCTAAEGEGCVCGSNGAPPSCKKVSVGRNECNFDDAQKAIRDCQEKANCPYDRQYQFFSNYYNAIPWTGNCMSDNCGSVIRSFMCCLGNGYDNVEYSWLHSGPMSCGNSVAITIIVVLLFVAAGISIIVTMVIVAIAIIKRKKEEGFSKLEN